jgi:hypothetical protein
MLRILLALLVAIMIAGVLGTIGSSWSSSGDIVALGQKMSLGERAAMAGGDVTSLGPRYAALIGIGALVAYPLALLFGRVAPDFRTAMLICAGAISVLFALGVLHFILGLPSFPGARTPLGVITQAGFGALAGYVFTLICPPGPARAGPPPTAA